jgi:hypothetical protein
MPASGAPLAITPFGYGTIASHAAPPEPVVSLTRKLDAQTLDYVLDDTGREFARMPKLKQRIYLALLTLRGSSAALPRMGIVLPKKLDGSATRRIQASVRDALREVLADGSLVIRRIDVAPHPLNTSRTIVGIEYLDVFAGRPDSARAVI